jgi:hypothetical protein
VETRTDEELGTALSGNMILREVPIEIGVNENTSDDEVKKQIDYSRKRRCPFLIDEDCDNSEDEDCDDFEDEECINFIGEECEKGLRKGLRAIKTDFLFIEASDEPILYNMAVQTPEVMSDCNTIIYTKSSKCRRSRSRVPDQRRSRSRSPNRRRSRSHSLDRRRSRSPEQKNTTNPSDIVRQIIGLQDFNGLWSINNIKQVITLLQSTVISKDDHLEQIVDDYKGQDNDVVLSMIIMFVFMKYFTDDEPLWKPVMKKCAKAMEDRLGKTEYHEMTDKIKQLV